MCTPRLCVPGENMTEKTMKTTYIWRIRCRLEDPWCGNFIYFIHCSIPQAHSRCSIKIYWMHTGYYTRFVDRDTMRSFISKETLQRPNSNWHITSMSLQMLSFIEEYLSSGFVHWLNSFIEWSQVFSYENICCNITYTPDPLRLFSCTPKVCFSINELELNMWDDNICIPTHKMSP